MYTTPLEVNSSRNFSLGDSAQKELVSFAIRDPIMLAGLNNQPEVVRSAIKESQMPLSNLLLKFAAGVRAKRVSVKNKKEVRARKALRDLPEEL
jgi:hypothetical protein